MQNGFLDHFTKSKSASWIFYGFSKKNTFLCSSDQYALFHMKKKIVLKKVKKDFDFVKYNKRVFCSQNMHQIEKKVAWVCKKFNLKHFLFLGIFL